MMKTQPTDLSGRWRSKLLALFACAASGAHPGASGMAAETATAPGDPVRGERLLAQYHCGSCHTIPGVAAARGRVAVTLESFGRRSYIAGRLPNTPQLLADWIVAPSALIPQTTMPAMGVSADDAKDMAAYLGKLR
jgi:cytochrome c